ncbi:MAG: hypothetical protein WCK46_01835 [Candidatus Adlerbacteria bacterium]
MSPAPSARRTFVFSITIACVVALLAYGLFEARRLIEGPRIVLVSPRDGSATSSSAVVISGTAENISFLTINDKPAFTDEEGHFTLTLSPPAGYTVFTARGVDRFGRRTSRVVSINVLNYCPLV